MSLTEPLLVQKLNAQLSYLTERQTLLAQNIANIDTPNYQARDLKKINFNDLATAESGRLQMRTSSGKHLSGSLSDGTHYSTIKSAAKNAQKPLGNNIVLEEQMGNISDVGAQHQLTSTLLRKFHQLYRIAVDNRG